MSDYAIQPSTPMLDESSTLVRMHTILQAGGCYHPCWCGRIHTLEEVRAMRDEQRADEVTNEQPPDFTHEDVALLREAAVALKHSGIWIGDAEKSPEARALRLADRIAARLPTAP